MHLQNEESKLIIVNPSFSMHAKQINTNKFKKFVVPHFGTETKGSTASAKDDDPMVVL